MAKTKEELKKLQEEVQQLNQKLGELSQEELENVTGGDFRDFLKKIGKGIKNVVEPVLKNPAPSIPTEKDDQNK